MAGYTENRKDNMEIKYLRKVLVPVDEKITVPDSVRGGALRHRLDQVQIAVPEKKAGKVFGLRWLSWQSGVTYAAAFALIVGLFYGLGFNQQPDMIDGTIKIDQEQADETVTMEAAEAELFAVDLPEAPSADDVELYTGEAGPQPESTGDQPAPQIDLKTIPGVGGGGKSAQLGSQNGYTYTWRNNDATDPDKGAYPVTVDIILDDGEQTVAQIDIADMQSVVECYLTDTSLSLIGIGEEGVITRSYSILEPEVPQELAVLAQPGSYVQSSIYRDVLHVVTFSEDVQPLDCETEALPYAVSDSACVISAVDTTDGAASQKAFLGAAEDISLFDRSAYIVYDGEAEEPPTEAGGQSVESEGGDSAADSEDLQDTEQDLSRYSAQILLNGTDIALGNVS